MEKPGKARLPYLLELKTLRPPTNIKEPLLGEWLYKQVRDVASQARVYKMNDCFDTCTSTNGLLLLLDGLDEVSKQNYPRVRIALDQLSRKLADASSSNVVIVTMRTQFYHQVRDDFRESIGQAFFIRPFSPSDIFEFLSRWPFGDKRSERRTQIYQDLTDRPTLREMCANPLVLSMYVADYEAAAGSVAPETRTEFYQRVTDELLIKRRLKQLGRAPAPAKLKEQREQILGRLAFEHLTDGRQPSNSLRWSDAVRITREVLNCDQEKANGAFEEIATETGLVSQERQHETFRFIHLTFCEFLAAYEAVQGQKDGLGALIRCHRDLQGENNPQVRSRLVEVLPFAVGLTARVRRPSVLSQIAELEDHRLLARCFLETKLYEHESWPKFLRVAEANLLSPHCDWDESWLRDLHLFGVVARDQQQCAEYSSGIGSVDLAAFYQRLASERQDQLSRLIEAFASQDAAAAFRVVEACDLDFLDRFPEVVTNSCDQVPFCELVLEKCRSIEHRGPRWIALLIEAALWSPPVARYLDNSPREAVFGNSATGHSGAWSQFGKSAYLQLVDIAVQEVTKGVPRECVLLPFLASVRPPGVVGRMIAITSFSLLTFGLTGLFMVRHSLIDSALLMLGFFISYGLLLRLFSRIVVCRRIINRIGRLYQDSIIDVPKGNEYSPRPSFLANLQVLPTLAAPIAFLMDGVFAGKEMNVWRHIDELRRHGIRGLMPSKKQKAPNLSTGAS